MSDGAKSVSIFYPCYEDWGTMGSMVLLTVQTAERLGNTAAICRASYISPAVLDEFERGRVIERHFEDVEELLERRGGGLHRSEKALLELLRRRAA